MERRLFLSGLGSVAISALVSRAGILGASLTGHTPARDAGASLAASLEATRAEMCLEIRTDPDVARDQAIFVDRWRRELGRIINLGGDSRSPRGAGVAVRERPPPAGSGGDCSGHTLSDC